jgi:hypothetical protein
LSIARRASVLVLMAGLMSAVQAADPQAPTKPAATGTTPAKPVTPPSAKKPAPAASPAPATTPVPEADDELLEFLGSVDADTGDQDWIDYLSRTDVGKVAKDEKVAKGPKDD